MTSGVTPQEIKYLVASGLTIGQIAEETGLGYDAVRGRLRRLGLRAKHEQDLDVRDIVQNMPPADAVEYLLGVIEQYSVVNVAEDHPVDSWDVGMTRSMRRVMIGLYDAAPGALRRDSVYSLLYFDRVSADDLPGDQILSVYICKMRALLPAHIGKIETVWGVGYRFVPAEGYAG